MAPLVYYTKNDKGEYVEIEITGTEVESADSDPGRLVVDEDAPEKGQESPEKDSEHGEGKEDSEKGSPHQDEEEEENPGEEESDGEEDDQISEPERESSDEDSEDSTHRTDRQGFNTTDTEAARLDSLRTARIERRKASQQKSPTESTADPEPSASRPMTGRKEPKKALVNKNKIRL